MVSAGQGGGRRWAGAHLGELVFLFVWIAIVRIIKSAPGEVGNLLDIWL